MSKIKVFKLMIFLTFVLSQIAFSNDLNRAATLANTLQKNTELTLTLPQSCKVSESIDACSDLFKASCMNDDGSFKTINLGKKIDQQIQTAFQNTLKKMGSGEVEKTFFEYLKKNGYEIKPDLSEENKNKLLQNKDIFNISEFFSNAPEACYNYIKIASAKEEQVRNIQNNSWQFDSQVSSLNWDIERAKADIKIYDANIALENMSDNQKKIYQESLEKSKEKLKNKELELEKIKKDFEASNKIVNDIYNEAFKAGDDAYDELKSRAKASYEKNSSSLIFEVMNLCDKDLKNAIETKIKEAKEKGDKQKINQEIYKFEIPKECSKNNLYNLRTEMIKINITKDSEKRKRAAKDLVERNFDLYLKLKDLNSKIYMTPALSTAPAVSQPQSTQKRNYFKELQDKNQKIMPVCESVVNRMREDFSDTYSNFFKNIARSKSTVDAMVDATYNQKQKEKMNELYGKAHAGVMGFIDEELGGLPELAGTDKFKKIRNETAKLGYSWLDKPGDEMYKKEADFPLPVLDFDKLPDNDDSMLTAFMDPSLASFKEMNAYYTPQIKFGDVETEEKVHFLPSINLLMEENPNAAMSVIAHEIGHKIGYKVSASNGYDLTKTYSKLVDCLSSDASISMGKNQADEAIADWISAKVMGKYLMSLPEKERKSSTLNLAGFFCEADGPTFYRRDINFQEVHPEATLRINGIFGANGDIRKALGCNGAKAECGFSECTLKGAK